MDKRVDRSRAPEGARTRFPADAGAIVLVELDGDPDGMEAAVLRVRRACARPRARAT